MPPLLVPRMDNFKKNIVMDFKTYGQKYKPQDFSPGDQFCVAPKGAEPVVAGDVWGIVCPLNTDERKSPPKPACFNTAETWFDSGHLMGLLLGGADCSTNLVPQMRFQNQRGEWKKHENDLFARAQQLWLTEGRYLYLCVTANYDLPSSRELHRVVPSSLTATVMELSGPKNGIWGDWLRHMDSQTAFTTAQAQELHPDAAVEKAFTNELTIQDLYQLQPAVEEANNFHAFHYLMGKVVFDFQRQNGLTLCDTGLKAYFNAGATLSAASKRTLTEWQTAYAAASDSSQFNPGMFGTVGGLDAEIAERLSSEENWQGYWRSQDGHWNDKGVATTNNPLATTIKPRESVIPANTKTGERRRRSVDAGKAGEIDRLKRALDGALEAENTGRTRSAATSSK